MRERSSVSENKWLRWVAVLAWMGLIFTLSAQPRLPHVVGSLSDQLQDVLGHFTVYAVLAALLYWALAGVGASRPALFALLIVLLYALSDEFHQSFVPGRNPDVFDVMTDVAGAAVALLLIRWRRSRRSRPPRS